MSLCTDPLRLNNNKLFKKLKNALPNSVTDTLNILEIREDILYVWNPKKYCIFTLNLGAVRSNPNQTVAYQTLQPTDPPIFEISNLLINETEDQAVLWGNLGIVLVDLPRRWGKENAFQGGKDIISCMNYNLNGYSTKIATAEIRRVRWHPGSANNAHLLVLTSENTFQLYECQIGTSPRLIKTYKIEPTPLASPQKTLPTIEALGDTAVDFDFSTPSIKTCSNDNSYEWNKIEWPILVLRGNGEVIVIYENILFDSIVSSENQKPLTMHPSTTDNYGTDSCSIMCIPTTPPVVIIASCSGKIYHSILLRNTNDEDNDDNINNDSFGKSEATLFVFEIVEIELGLLYHDNEKKYTCPIQLHLDRGNKSRYFCFHNAGIHMITLPVILQLEKFTKSSDENSDINFPSTLHQSNSQYLVCTRTKHTKINEVAPILGFGLLQQPCPILIALLHTGIVVDLTIVDLDYLPTNDMINNSINCGKKIPRESFDNYIRGLLKHDSTSHPITQLDTKSKMSGKEYLELLYHATDVFRRQYFEKHDRVRKDMERKVDALKRLKEHQLRELEILMEAKKELHRKAEDLADKYEDIKGKQEDFAKRAEEVLRLVNYKKLSSIEQMEAFELKELDNKVQDFVIRICQLKKKDNQNSHIENNKLNDKKNELILNNKQEEAIKSNIGQMAKDITAMISQVKSLENDLDI